MNDRILSGSLDATVKLLSRDWKVTCTSPGNTLSVKSRVRQVSIIHQNGGDPFVDLVYAGALVHLAAFFF